MAAAVHDQMPLNRMADQRQIADHIQNLVPHELVLEPQRIEHAGLAEDDRVLERAAERQAALAQHLDFLQEAERPRRRNLVDEHLLVESIVFCWCRSSGWSKLIV